MKRMITFFKRETVLCIAMILALVSSFVVTPDMQYIDYVDYRTLAILFCLMAVMAGYSEIGVFTRIAKALLNRVNRLRGIIVILVMLCFVSSMFITNDVALITFVPLTFIVLELLGEPYQKKWMVPIVTMQTIAANMGSMLTPIGNPQNLYLYTKSGMEIGRFIMIMLPYSLSALLGLLVWMFVASRGEQETRGVLLKADDNPLNWRKFAVYTVLFVVCLGTVAKMIPYTVALVLVTVLVAVCDYRIFRNVDYSLLLTFVGFFIFIGNLGRVEMFKAFLERIIEKREIVTCVLSSQFMSNMPAALLLSGFTKRYDLLMIGVNLGGLGTLIASMASLISFKYIVRENETIKGKYLLSFSAASIVFLVIEFLTVWVFA